jgi:leucyl aminopeptidase
MGDGITEMLLFGVGDGSPSALRKAGATIARHVRGRGKVIACAPSAASEDALAAFAEGLLLASYDFRVGGPAKRPGAETISVVTSAQAALERGITVARAVALARDLTNTTSREKCPQWLAERAEELAGDAGLTVRVRDENALEAEGFGGIVAVGSGSSRPPRLIELTYEPEGAQGEHVVLVGKGITFDSGGLSLKSNEGMKTMKTDMAGGAVVISVMSALRTLGVPVKVTGLVAAAENMPSGSAMRPGDVIRHYGGTTSEVLNTDAEGRLVLADALAYADAELDPGTVVDIATLTGAAKVALGLRHGALYATDDTLAGDLTAAGETSGETLWRMPLVEEYRPAIDSEVADIANVGRGVPAGVRRRTPVGAPGRRRPRTRQLRRRRAHQGRHRVRRTPPPRLADLRPGRPRGLDLARGVAQVGRRELVAAHLGEDLVHAGVPGGRDLDDPIRCRDARQVFQAQREQFGAGPRRPRALACGQERQLLGEDLAASRDRAAPQHR